MRTTFLTALVVILAAYPNSSARAGYEAPVYIDGCRSADGRYEITTELIEHGKNVHGPNAWLFHWKDVKTGESRSFSPEGLQRSQIYAHLFLAPDGKTFALWNHVTLAWPEKSASHAHDKLPPREETEAWRRQEVFNDRLIIFRNDGTRIKSFAVADFLQPEEWETVLPVFNRVHWIREYPDLHFKKTPRTGYAFYRISPDYTVLEFLATSSRADRRNPPRVVRVSLTDGRILAEGEEIADPAKIPVRPYLGDDQLPGSEKEWREGYRPSLDPVRVAGEYTTRPPQP